MRKANLKLSIIKINKFFIASFLAILLGMAFVFSFSEAYAQAPIVQCGNPGQPMCNLCDLYTGIRRIINFLLVGVAVPLATAAMIWGGIVLVTSGSSDRHTLGKTILWYTALGFLITLGAWLIVNTILDTVGFRLPFGTGQWWNYEICKKFDEFKTVTGGPSVPTTPTTPTMPSVPTTGGRNCPNCTNLSLSATNTACRKTASGICQIDASTNEKLKTLQNELGKSVEPLSLTITEAYPPILVQCAYQGQKDCHKDACHWDGTCVDAKLIAPTYTGKQIGDVVTRAKNAQLDAYYEVADKTRANKLISQGVPASNIWVTGAKEHFHIRSK
ncbi:TrbC/VirB2 family protein [Candidatus Giovannonibacteria bacterium]|nr:TrbC/VirB2 family protein [Candidatus Giovannonibacteria bacterium]